MCFLSTILSLSISVCYTARKYEKANFPPWYKKTRHILQSSKLPTLLRRSMYSIQRSLSQLNDNYVFGNGTWHSYVGTTMQEGTLLKCYLFIPGDVARRVLALAAAVSLLNPIDSRYRLYTATQPAWYNALYYRALYQAGCVSPYNISAEAEDRSVPLDNIKAIMIWFEINLKAIMLQSSTSVISPLCLWACLRSPARLRLDNPLSPAGSRQTCVCVLNCVRCNRPRSRDIDNSWVYSFIKPALRKSVA